MFWPGKCFFGGRVSVRVVGSYIVLCDFPLGVQLLGGTTDGLRRGSAGYRDSNPVVL